MKKIKLLALVAIASIALFSCGKDKDATGENPMKAVIDAKTLTTPQSDGLIQLPTKREVGNKITFKKDGKVTQLGLYIGLTGSYKVSFWDFDSKVLLAQTTINVTGTSTFNYVDITAVNVTANKAYVLSMNTTNTATNVAVHPKLVTNANKTAIYPFTSGNVVYEQRLTKTSDVSVFPDQVSSNDQLQGIADITFVPNK